MYEYLVEVLRVSASLRKSAWFTEHDLLSDCAFGGRLHVPLVDGCLLGLLWKFCQASQPAFSTWVSLGNVLYKTLHKREKSLVEILSPSLFPAKPKNSENRISSCKKCDICKYYLLTDNKFKLQVGFVMSEATCLVMSSTWFLVKTVKINTQDQLLTSRPDLEFIKVR